MLARRVTSPRARATLLSLAPWSAPLLAYIGLRELTEVTMRLFIQLALVAAFGAVMSKRPGVAAASLCIGFPLAEVILPYLLHIGMPLAHVKVLRYWKEALIFALVLAAVRASREHPLRLDRFDKIALGYVAVAVVYWLFPKTFPPDEVLAPTDARNLAFRTMALPIVAFMATRHAYIGGVWRQRILVAAATAGVILGLSAMFEVLFPGSWATFINETLEVPRYRFVVQGDPLAQTISGTDITLSGDLNQRAGTLLLDPLRSGFALIAPLAVSLDIVRRRLRPAPMVAVGVIAVGLGLTLTRSAVLAGVLVLLGALRSGPGRSERSRAQLILLVCLVSVAVAPNIASSVLVSRISGAVTGADQESTPFHLERSRNALELVLENPLGIGLGRGGLSSVRYQLQGNVIAENNYLGLAQDVGIFGAALFITLIVSIIVNVRRRFAQIDDASASAADLLTGLAAASMFLHPFDYFAVGAPAWIITGLAMAVSSGAALPAGPRSEHAAVVVSKSGVEPREGPRRHPVHVGHRGRGVG